MQAPCKGYVEITRRWAERPASIQAAAPRGWAMGVRGVPFPWGDLLEPVEPLWDFLGLS